MAHDIPGKQPCLTKGCWCLELGEDPGTSTESLQVVVNQDCKRAALTQVRAGVGSPLQSNKLLVL